jgi:hypothetical protein
MRADLASDNDPDNHRDSGDTIGFPIPSPRPAADDHIENLSITPPQQHVWQYDQRGKRGKHRRYTGHVTPIGGAEGDRIRGELAAIIRDLLDWATRHTETPDTDSPQGGGADDIPS